MSSDVYKAQKRRFPLWTAAAAGSSDEDFYVLAHSREYDDAFESKNRITPRLPTQRYSFVLHFVKRRRVSVFLFKDRLLDLTWSAVDGVAYAVGFPRRVWTVRANGLDEVEMADQDPMFAIAAAHDGALVACGGGSAVIRHRGRWRALALPRATPNVWAVGYGPGGEAWLGGHEGAVVTICGKRKTLAHHPAAGRIRAIVPFDRGRAYVASSGRLFVATPKTLRATVIEDDEEIGRIALWGGRIWIPTTKGVIAFDGKRVERVLARAADSISCVGDSLVVSNHSAAVLFDGKKRIALDVVV